MRELGVSRWWRNDWPQARRRSRRRNLLRLEVARCGLAAVGRDHVEGNLLAFGQRRQPRLLDGADMDEHILAAVGRLDETVTLLRVEPFHGTGRHCSFLIARACRRDRTGIARLQSIQFSGSALQVAAMERLGPSIDGRNSIAPKAERNRRA